MPLDSDPIAAMGSPDDFTSLFADALCGVQYKLFVMLFIVFMILSSDVFINRALSKFHGAVDCKYPTSWGTTLQGLFLVLACVVLDVAVCQQII